MTTATLTLTEFLLARIAEDEASVAAIRRPPMWQSRISTLNGDLSQFVARQHPARVLAECEAKRRILHAAQFADEVEGGGAAIVMLDGYPRDRRWGVLPALAAVYSDHPDYREEWF